VETPADEEPVMREFRMKVPFPDGPSVTGILDRVDADKESGEWIVVDYKTGMGGAEGGKQEGRKGGREGGRD